MIISICTQILWIPFFSDIFLPFKDFTLIFLAGLAQHMFISMCARSCTKYLEIVRDMVCSEK